MSIFGVRLFVCVLALLVALAWAVGSVKWAQGDEKAADVSITLRNPPVAASVGDVVTYVFEVQTTAEVRNVAVLVTWPTTLQPHGLAMGGSWRCVMLDTGDLNAQKTLCSSGFLSPGQRGWVVQSMRVSPIALAGRAARVQAVVLHASAEGYWPNNLLEFTTTVRE
jgi:hypothetical protein